MNMQIIGQARMKKKTFSRNDKSARSEIRVRRIPIYIFLWYKHKDRDDDDDDHTVRNVHYRARDDGPSFLAFSYKWV